MVNKYERESKKWFKESGSYYNTKYQSRCDKCRKLFVVTAQEDDSPEYYTHIAIDCDCGGKAYFELPVN